ncbi:hypothetical protein [Halarsenatibacter silvermanii]|uniref:Outer membrane protein beta-barrel domain-containing protein n=1 Tax=Halarsenatibacter silvermanii TaxID=321763 RepID=A0A1G9LVN1_9FIRM|nr:hypothetical protein [Halarsenatibacter silvermanii]SDL65874.1 hypothetical protein SAMN04488692_10721 [Halarsenatibacter silvermanii]
MKKVITLSLSAVLIIFMTFVYIPGNIRAETVDMEADTEILEQGLAGLNLRVGSGLAVGFLRMNIGDLNDLLEEDGFPALDRNVFLYGAGAVAGRVEGDRLGAVYRRGSVDSSTDGNQAGLSLNYAGLIYERGREVEDRENTDIALGLMGGIGSMELYWSYI